VGIPEAVAVVAALLPQPLKSAVQASAAIAPSAKIIFCLALIRFIILFSPR
jgi:hypothetical protein